MKSYKYQNTDKTPVNTVSMILGGAVGFLYGLDSLETVYQVFTMSIIGALLGFITITFYKLIIGG